MNIELLNTIEPVEFIASSWRELANGIPFRQPEWLLTWWENFKTENDELYVLVARDDALRVRAIAPWYRDRKQNVVRFLGDGRVCADDSSLLIDTRYMGESVPDSMAETMIELSKANDGWSTLHFESVGCCDSEMDAFKRAMQNGGSKVIESQPSVKKWQIELSGGWTDFLDGVSTHARTTFRQHVFELDKVRVHWVHDRADFDEFMPILMELHQKRRISLGDEGCFADQRFEKFLRESSLQFLARNQLQAFTLWNGQRPIAAEFGFRNKNRWQCYKTGIDPEWTENESGKLANTLILRNADRFGITTVDFLEGNEPYEPQLKANSHFVRDLRFTKPNAGGNLGDLWSKSTAKASEIVSQFKRKFMRKK